MTTLALSPLPELRDWLAASVARLRTARQFQPLARVTVAADITADAISHANTVAAAAHRSEALDLEAERILDHLLAEHRDLTAADRAEIKRARSFVHRSALADHAASEAVRVPAA